MPSSTALIVCIVLCIIFSLCVSSTGGGGYYYYDKYIKTQAPTTAPTTPSSTPAPPDTTAPISTPAGTSNSTVPPAGLGSTGSSTSATPTPPPNTTAGSSTVTPNTNTATNVPNTATGTNVNVNAPTPPTLNNQPLQCMTRVLDCAGGNCNENNALQLYTKNGAPGQNFTFNADGTITSNGRCITVSSDNRSVTMVSPNHTGQQLWRWVWNATTNAWNLQNQSNNFYLDVIGSRDGDGTGIDVLQTATAVGQQWVPTTPGTPPTPTLTGQGLQPGVSTTRLLDCNGAAILKKNNGSTGQGFTFNSNGTITSGGNCLAVKPDNKTVDMEPCSGNTSTLWKWVWNGATWGLKNQGSQNMLNVWDSVDADGTSVTVWPANGSTAQQWTPVNQVAPPPPAPTLNNQPLKIMSHVMDCAGGTCANGTKTQLWDNIGQPGQLWTLNSDGTLQNPASGKVLSVNGGAQNNGAAVQPWDNVGGADQKWNWLYAGNNNWQLQNTQSQRCLDAAGANDSNGTQLQLWDCDTSGTHWITSTNQNHPVLNNGYLQNQTRVLNCAGGSCGSNSNLVKWDKNNGANEKFTWNDKGDGTGTITNNNYCLDIVNGMTIGSGASTNGARLRTTSCNNLPSQAWKWVYQPSSSTWSLQNPQTGGCIDVSSGGDSNNTSVRLWQCNGQANPQGWYPS